MNLSSHSTVDFVNKIDQLVFGCLITSSDILLQGRRANFVPKTNNIISVYSNNSDFCARSLNFWKNELTMPLCFDISVLQPQSRKLLMERWKFSYQRRVDLKEGRISSIKKRIVTFLRTLYSFIRLLPGYQVLKFIPQVPNLMFELSSVENPPISPLQLESDTWRTYEFPPISTTKGILSVVVNYVDSAALQKVFKFNANVSSFSPVTFKDSYKSKPANPIPIQQQNPNYDVGVFQKSSISPKIKSQSPIIINNSINVFDNFQTTQKNHQNSPNLREQHHHRPGVSPSSVIETIQHSHDHHRVLTVPIPAYSQKQNSVNEFTQLSLEVSPTNKVFIRHGVSGDGTTTTAAAATVATGQEYGSSSLSPTPMDDNKYVYGDTSQKNIYITNLTGVSPPFPLPPLNSEIRMSNSNIEDSPVLPSSHDYLLFLNQKTLLSPSPFQLIVDESHVDVININTNDNNTPVEDSSESNQQQQQQCDDSETAVNYTDTQQTFQFDDNDDNEENEPSEPQQQSNINHDTTNTATTTTNNNISYSSSGNIVPMKSNESQLEQEQPSPFTQQLNMLTALSGYAIFPTIQSFELPTEQSIESMDFIAEIESQLQELKEFRSNFMSSSTLHGLK